MKVLIILVAACIAGSMAQDCSTKLKAFHQCLEDTHKQAKQAGQAKFQAIKAKLDACYTSNGCTPPAKPAHGEKGEHHEDKTTGGECGKAVHDAMKVKFEDCIKQAIPGFTIPPKDANHDKPHREEHGGFHHGDDKALEGCAKKEAVRACQRALMNSTRPTEAEKKAQFQARCDAKQKCQLALGAECLAQMQKFKKAACQCRQQQEGQKDQIRAGIKACQGVEDRKGTHSPRAPKQESCDRKDYCKLGYDAFVQDHPRGERKEEHH